MSHFRGRPLWVRDILYLLGFLWAQGIVDLSRKEPQIVTALLLGLASGVGFGVSEGITYASNDYNGIETVGIYGVRFISCVALHSMWSAAAAITAFERQRLVKETIQGAAGRLQDVSYLLSWPYPWFHGFYDTLLEKQMDVAALAVAFANFVWMRFKIEWLFRLELLNRAGRERDVGTNNCVIHCCAL